MKSNRCEEAADWMLLKKIVEKVQSLEAQVTQHTFMKQIMIRPSFIQERYTDSSLKLVNGER